MKRLWIVETHLGHFKTWAVSAKKAIANIRYRLAGAQCNCPTTFWTARTV